MDEPFQVECPRCGFKGKLGGEPPDGATLRCAKCQEVFNYRRPASRADAAPPSVFKPIPEPKRPSSTDWVDSSVLKSTEARIRGLQRWNRVLAVALIVLTAACGFCWWEARRANETAALAVNLVRLAETMRENAPPPDELRANQIFASQVFAGEVVIPDENGKALVRIGPTINGKRVGMIILSEAESSSSCLLMPRAVSLLDDGGTTRIDLSTNNETNDHDALFQLSDRRGVVRYEARTRGDDVNYSLMDRKGGTLITSGITATGGIFLNYRDPEDGKIQAVVPVPWSRDR